MINVIIILKKMIVKKISEINIDSTNNVSEVIDHNEKNH